MCTYHPSPPELIILQCFMWIAMFVTGSFSYLQCSSTHDQLLFFLLRLIYIQFYTQGTYCIIVHLYLEDTVHIVSMNTNVEISLKETVPYLWVYVQENCESNWQWCCENSILFPERSCPSIVWAVAHRDSVSSTCLPTCAISVFLSWCAHSAECKMWFYFFVLSYLFWLSYPWESLILDKFLCVYWIIWMSFQICFKFLLFEHSCFTSFRKIIYISIS